jgi:hypothetical protein
MKDLQVVFPWLTAPKLRVLAVLACLGQAVLWLVFLYADPYGHGDLTAGSHVVGWLMIACSILGALASFYPHPIWMYVLFVGSFFPVGLYLAGTPGIFQWIAGLDLLFLLCAVVLHVSDRPPS